MIQTMMEENKKQVGTIIDKIFLVLTIGECLILAFGTLISISTSAGAISYSPAFLPYLGIALLGLVMLGLLIRLMRKRPVLAFAVGIVLIVVLAIVGAWGSFKCLLGKQRMAHLQAYRQNDVTLMMDGELFAWDGKSVVYKEDGKVEIGWTIPVNDWITEDFQCCGLPESKQVYKDEQTQTYYIKVYHGGTGEWLVMDWMCQD